MPHEGTVYRQLKGEGKSGAVCTKAASHPMDVRRQIRCCPFQRRANQRSLRLNSKSVARSGEELMVPSSSLAPGIFCSEWKTVEAPICLNAHALHETLLEGFVLLHDAGATGL